MFKFEGAVISIYATLTVRLTHSGQFSKIELWKNAATYHAEAGGTCGFFLRQVGDGNGEITVFFDKEASSQTRFEFEGYIRSHLLRHCLSDNITLRRVSVCEVCGFVATDQMLALLRIRDMSQFRCPVCETYVIIYSEAASLDQIHPFVAAIDKEADAKRNQAVSASILQGKRVVKEFDTFLAHNTNDKADIVRISNSLKNRGLNPWLDQEQIPPGRWFQDVIQKAIPNVKSVCVFFGKSGVGRWQDLEIKSFITECVERSIPVIPVLLPGITEIPHDKAFLREYNWVRFEKDVEELAALDQLEWGITGRKPERP